jgi:hypothetical protein
LEALEMLRKEMRAILSMRCTAERIRGNEFSRVWAEGCVEVTAKVKHPSTTDAAPAAFSRRPRQLTPRLQTHCCVAANDAMGQCTKSLRDSGGEAWPRRINQGGDRR